MQISIGRYQDAKRWVRVRESECERGRHTKRNGQREREKECKNSNEQSRYGQLIHHHFNWSKLNKLTQTHTPTNTHVRTHSQLDICDLKIKYKSKAKSYLVKLCDCKQIMSYYARRAHTNANTLTHVHAFSRDVRLSCEHWDFLYSVVIRINKMNRTESIVSFSSFSHGKNIEWNVRENKKIHILLLNQLDFAMCMQKSYAQLSIAENMEERRKQQLNSATLQLNVR